VYHLTYSRQW